MAGGGRHYFFPGNPRFRSPVFLFGISFLSLSFLFYIFYLLSSPSPTPSYSSQNPSVDYSFVTSLEKFLQSTSKYQTRSRDDTVVAVSEDDVKRLDDLIWKTETQRLYQDSFYPTFSPSLPSAIRVYVYEMPIKFTYDMLWLFRNTYKETYNLTSNGSPVHRLIEQVFNYSHLV